MSVRPSRDRRFAAARGELPRWYMREALRLAREWAAQRLICYQHAMGARTL